MPSARRLLTLGGAAFVGIAATALFAATPASAHSASGEALACKTTTGSWQVAWKIDNDYGNPVTLTRLKAQPGDIDGIGQDAEITARGSITGTQELDENGIKDAQLSYVPVWQDDYKGGKQTVTPKLRGDCTPGKPKPPEGCKPGKPGGGDKPGKPGDCTPPCKPEKPGKPGDKPGKPGDGKGHPRPCESASASPSPSGGTGGGGGGGESPSPSAPPSLPVTGSQAAIYGGGAAVLLGAGAGLFFVARRRRISFEA